MKSLLGFFVLTAASAMAANNETPFWTAICRGDKDANFSMTLGAGGGFSTGNGDGTYVTWPLKQSSYDGNVLCGAVAGSASVAQVCADNPRQMIFMRTRDPKKPNAPLKTVDYCDALVKIH
jgi:hypothetical protein